MATVDLAGRTAVRRGTTAMAQPYPAPTQTAMQTPSPTAPQFDDPGMARIESHAVSNYDRLTNPAADSPGAMFEKYLGTLAEKLQQPAYSQADEAAYKGGALDAVQKEQDAQEKRWAEEMGRRGIQPSSGVYLDGLKNIRNHYGALRTQEHGNFARKAIDDTRTQRMQAADVLGRGVDAVRSREATAGQYAQVPYQLSQDSFARNLSLVNGGDSPQAYLNSQMGVAQGQQRTQMYNQANQAEQMEALMELLAQMGYV